MNQIASIGGQTVLLPPINKVALITGIGGQDGSTLADILLAKGYTVHGIIRRASNFNTNRIEHIFNKIHLHYGDLTDAGNILSIIQNVKPDELYNLAAQSHVKVSCELENYTFQTNTLGLLNILQAIRTLDLTNKTKVYQASTSEIYGNTTDGTVLLTEKSAMNPVSPYAISKLAAHHIANYYRDAYGMFVVSSILMNHEGERRGHTFVTQKIAAYVGKYANSSTKPPPLQLGNLNAKRDWSHARDMMHGVWLMMQYSKPDNYVLASGEEHSVREFVELSFNEIDIEIEWRGSGSNEKGYHKTSGELLVEVNPKYYRPIDIAHLVGDASKAKNVLGWKSEVGFKELVKLMTQHQIKQFA
jgi:GDPmannose 4,6-dehydratase